MFGDTIVCLGDPGQRTLFVVRVSNNEHFLLDRTVPNAPVPPLTPTPPPLRPSPPPPLPLSLPPTHPCEKSCGFSTATPALGGCSSSERTAGRESCWAPGRRPRQMTRWRRWFSARWASRTPPTEFKPAPSFSRTACDLFLRCLHHQSTAQQTVLCCCLRSYVKAMEVVMARLVTHLGVWSVKHGLLAKNDPKRIYNS